MLMNSVECTCICGVSLQRFSRGKQFRLASADIRKTMQHMQSKFTNHSDQSADMVSSSDVGGLFAEVIRLQHKDMHGQQLPGTRM